MPAKKIATAFAVLLFNTLFAQTYQADWKSLDSRPVPQWFRDAKFGIFIHWGVYAVPGWSSKGNYAEWYQHGLQTNDSARKKFHKTKFGNRTYYDLANDFKAELYNPDDWAKLFEQSGAKYIVLTSKHHDGYTLWPNKEANKTWGFKWNAMEIGPGRDLLGELFTAVRKTSVRAGMYYSLYEWFNPLWKSDPAKFAREHTWPQMRELIDTYQPDVFWTDGDWDAPAETWKSQEFLAWLYNESPVKEKIVVNDRWGAGIRFNHGGIYTPEYQPDLDFEDHYWEESRGMGYSYGYNREEDAWDYNSTQSLILQLVDKVSRGGNFLLDIGPDEHGKIPPIMQERLLQIGDWLKVNGEAIYGTSRWKEHSQWSEGRRDYKDKSGDMLLKITVNPDPGYAVKELFFTYKQATNSLYAIFPKYPDNRKLVLREIEVPATTSIRLLETGEKLNWVKQGNDLVVELPVYNPNKIKSPHAYVIKIEGYGKFLPKPQIKTQYKKGSGTPLVTIISQPSTKVRYTIDGSEPSPASGVYDKPFNLQQTSVLKAVAFSTATEETAQQAIPSAVATASIVNYKWMKPVKATRLTPGLAYKYYEPSGKIDLKALEGADPAGIGIAPVVSVSAKKRLEKFGFVFEGYIQIAKDGFYDFFLASDDGSKLFIDGMEVVDNDGDHGTIEKSGRAALKKGFHSIRITYYDSGGGNELRVGIQPEDGKKTEIPSGMLYHQAR